MLRRILGAFVALGLGTAVSVAEPVFDGTFVYQPGANVCSGAGNSFSAVYRPQIGAGATKSGLVVSLYRSGVGFTLPGNGQFSGAGAFIGIGLSSSATVTNRTGNFVITQAPAAVVVGTQSISLTGRFTPSVGCQHIFKALFLRRPGT